MMGSNDKPQDEFFYSFNLDDNAALNGLILVHASK